MIVCPAHARFAGLDAPSGAPASAPGCARAPEAADQRIATAPAPARMSRIDRQQARALWQAARASVEKNLEAQASGTYVTAGRHQFKSLWTRDFCMSAPGLLAMGRGDVVRDQLELLLGSLRPEDGLVPRTLDSMDAKLRAIIACGKNVLPVIPNPALGEDLRPEYADQHGSLAIDGNLLVILTALRYADATGDAAFLEAHAGELSAALRFYEGRRAADGLITQPPFSDWQDSVRREGKAFMTNLLYWSVLDQLGRRGLCGVRREQAGDLRRSIEATFRDRETGLYRSMAEGPQISLDGNLLAIDLGYWPADTSGGRSLYNALVRHPLWTQAGGLPGTTTPDYPRSWLNLAPAVVGLEHYHDRLAWSWLSALAIKTAARMGDEGTAQRLLSRWSGIVARDGDVGEIYQPTAGAEPFASLLYRSETPFTWGAAAFVEALQPLR